MTKQFMSSCDLKDSKHVQNYSGLFRIVFRGKTLKRLETAFYSLDATFFVFAKLDSKFFVGLKVKFSPVAGDFKMLVVRRLKTRKCQKIAGAEEFRKDGEHEILSCWSG
ncbi:hypothetical protein J6590_013679 [Homalodisca vitripennis]|nr:hypothetical protein J6590_013679 [Homalodisca vitripennis]